MDSELRETAVQSALSTRWLGRNYHFFETIGSTNVRLGEMVSAGESDVPPVGMVLLADYQSQGRGRLDRHWLAPPGTSLLLSMLFRPEWPPEQAQWLTMIASLAAAEAMEAMTSLNIGVKWPNDLVIPIDNVWQKVSGLLLEGSMGVDGRLQHAILGIGMNVNIPVEHLPETDPPAISLLAATGQSISRLTLLADFLGRLETYYEAAEIGRSPHPPWKQRLITLGQRVQVTNRGDASTFSGVAEDTDAWGQLLVREDNGRLHTVSAGDVTLRGDASDISSLF